MRLKRQKHIVLGPEFDGPVCRAYADRRLAVVVLDRQAFLTHGREMGTARDKAHLGFALPGKPGADKPANGAGTEDADAHQPSPSFSARPMRCSLPVAPFGISSRKTSLRGTLNPASRLAAK